MKTIDPTSKRSGNIVHALYVAQRGRCFYCGARKMLGELTRDHVFPRTHGGSNGMTENGILSCAPCNAEKADRLPTDNEVKAARVFNEAARVMTKAWALISSIEYSHMGDGQKITGFVDRAMTGQVPEPMESTNAD